MNKSTLLAAAALACIAAVPATATPYQSATAPAAGTSTINFDTGAADRALLTNQYPGVTFTNLYQNNNYDGGFPNITGGTAADFTGTNGTIAPLANINFNTVVSSAIFNYVSNPGTTVFSTFLNGTLVETAALATGYNGNFTGFQNSAFNSLTINSAAAGNGGFLVDNLSFNTVAAVPEPATWAMMILGMGAVGFAMRSAKRRSDEKFDAKIKRITDGALA